MSSPTAASVLDDDNDSFEMRDVDEFVFVYECPSDEARSASDSDSDSASEDEDDDDTFSIPEDMEAVLRGMSREQAVYLGPTTKSVDELGLGRFLAPNGVVGGEIQVYAITEDDDDEVDNQTNQRHRYRYLVTLGAGATGSIETSTFMQNFHQAFPEVNVEVVDTRQTFLAILSSLPYALLDRDFTDEEAYEGLKHMLVARSIMMMPLVVDEYDERPSRKLSFPPHKMVRRGDRSMVVAFWTQEDRDDFGRLMGIMQDASVPEIEYRPTMVWDLGAAQ